MLALKKTIILDTKTHCWPMYPTTTQQQEQDPTNLYIANLPPHFKETDLEAMLAKYGQVVSTRILRDQQMNSKGEYYHTETTIM